MHYFTSIFIDLLFTTILLDNFTSSGRASPIYEISVFFIFLLSSYVLFPGFSHEID